MIAKAIEEGYKQYLMQHKFPLCVLHITMDTETVDVNVHPSKMDVRFSDGMAFARMLSEKIAITLRNREMIPDASLEDEKAIQKKEQEERRASWKEHTPEVFEKREKKAIVSWRQQNMKRLPGTGENLYRNLSGRKIMPGYRPVSASRS